MDKDILIDQSHQDYKKEAKTTNPESSLQKFTIIRTVLKFSARESAGKKKTSSSSPITPQALGKPSQPSVR